MTPPAKTLILAAAFSALTASAASARDLTIGLSAEPSSIDPHFHNLSPNNQTRSNIFESLVAQDETQKLKPALATKWEAVDDTTWRFTLRKGVTFSNGADFTAKDVIYSACRIPTVKDSPSAFTSYVKYFADMKAEDDHTLLIKTDAPAPLLPIETGAWRILSASVNGATGPITYKREGCEGLGTPPQSTDFNKPEIAVGTGPYKLVSTPRGDRIVLERNDGYWGGKPDWDKIIMRPITSDAPRVAALLAGDVDLIETPPVQDLDRIQKAGFKVVKGLSNRIIYLHMDQEGDTPGVSGTDGRNPFLDPKVRAAFSMAINRKAIVDRIMGGAALIWISHDLAVVSALADRIAVMYAGRIVEQGRAADVIEAPLHPYTRGLIDSAPSRNERGAPLRQIPGMAPSILALPEGCAFRPRCPRGDDMCLSAPPEAELRPGQFARCFHPHLAEARDGTAAEAPA